MSPFAGFPDNSEYTPVPNLLFGSLLEEIDDTLALKCFLRVLWLHSQKKGIPGVLIREELLSDRTLARVVSTSGESIEAVLDRTARLGLLLHLRVESDRGVFDVYVPNTPKGRRGVNRLKDSRPDLEVTDHYVTTPEAAPRPNIFSLYEDNIGIITPLIAEQLKDAERQYPEVWIEESFREAVAGNKRSWRYIEAILKRWKTEGKDLDQGLKKDGKDDGEHRGHPEKIDAREWIRRHGLPGSSR